MRGKKCRIRGNFGKNVENVIVVRIGMWENVENKKRPEILVFRVIKTNFCGILLYRRVRNQGWSIAYPMCAY